MKKLLLAALLLVPSIVSAQIEARQATPEEAKTRPPQTELPSPMLLEVPLTGNGTASKPHVVDLPTDRTRLIRDTAAYVCDKLTVENVSIRKRKGRKGKVELVVAPSLRTEHYRQKASLAVTLLNGDQEVKTFRQKEMVLGFSAGDIIGGGALGAANPDKTHSEEIVWEFASEEDLRTQIGGPEAKLRIVVGIIE